MLGIGFEANGLHVTETQKCLFGRLRSEGSPVKIIAAVTPPGYSWLRIYAFLEVGCEGVDLEINSEKERP